MLEFDNGGDVIYFFRVASVGMPVAFRSALNGVPR